MARTIYNDYLSGETERFSRMGQDALQGAAEQQARDVLSRQQQNQEQQYQDVSVDRQQRPSMQRGMESIMNATNPMALSPEQLLAVKAMNQRNNSKYLFDIAKKSRESGNVADSQKYVQFAKQHSKNAVSLERDALMTRREILADDSLLLKNVHDQQSLNSVVSLAELRGRPMTELLQMTDEGMYSSKTKNYVDSRLGQLGQERDWLDTSVQVLDDETRYFDRVTDDERSTAYDKVLMRRDAIAQQNLVKEERDYLKTVPQSYPELIKKQKAALRNTLSEKQIQNLEKINPELATIERKRKEDITDPVKYADSLGYDLDKDIQSVQSKSDKVRDTIKALPSPEVILQEWRSAKRKAPSEDELYEMELNKDPMYDMYKAQADQIDTIDKFVKNKYGVSMTEQDMKDPMEREIYIDETGQSITTRALIDTATKHRMSVDQVLRELGVPYEEREKILKSVPGLEM